MAREVQSPDGRRWTVRRRWVPRLGADTVWGRFHRRFRRTFRRTGDVADLDPGCAFDIGEGIAASFAVLIVILVLLFIVFPLLVAVVDVVVVLLLALAGLAGRIVFRRPWVVEANADDGRRLVWPVVGWGASNRHGDEVAQLLEAGITPPDATEVTPGAV